MDNPVFASLQPYFAFLVPILIIQVVLLIVALLDLVKQEHTRGPKWMWAVIIIFINFIGPVVYFVIGRKDE